MTEDDARRLENVATVIVINTKDCKHLWEAAPSHIKWAVRKSIEVAEMSVDAADFRYLCRRVQNRVDSYC